jgi:hypothetical protein
MGLGCEDQQCRDFAGPLYLQLSRGQYDRCSVLPLDRTIEQWRETHRTARKRAAHAERMGYRFELIDRERFSEDIYQINISLDERQGRPMSSSYRQRTDFSKLPDYRCDQHRVNTYGVLTGGRLVAYLWLYRAGDLALVSSILGHGEHLRGNIMYLLMQGTIERELETGGFLVYNRHDSGTDGLRFYKERMGFTEETVRWAA